MGGFPKIDAAGLNPGGQVSLPEEDTCHDFGRKPGAIQGNEWSGAILTQGMNDSCYFLFAGPIFSFQKDGLSNPRSQAYLLYHAFHGGEIAFQITKGPALESHFSEGEDTFG